MSREDARDLVREIHAAYPSWRLDDPEGTIDFWWHRLEHEELSTARKAFYQYIDNDERTYAPQVGQIKKLIDKLKGNQNFGCTMVFDRDYNVVHWKPSPEHDVIDIPVVWDSKQKCYVDDEGRQYIDPYQDYSEKEREAEERTRVQKHNEHIANQLNLSEIARNTKIAEEQWAYDLYD